MVIISFVAVIVMVDATMYGIVIVSGIGIVIVFIIFLALLLVSYHNFFITIILSIVVIIMTIIIMLIELFTVIDEYECV